MGMKATAVIFGVFDLTHYGHYTQFKRLKDLGFIVKVGVVSDKFAQSYKRKPIMNQKERMKNVLHCSSVSSAFISKGKFVREMDKLTDDEWCTKNVKVITHGSDWSREDYMKHMGFTQKWLDSKELILIQLPYTKGVSTSDLIKRSKDAPK